MTQIIYVASPESQQIYVWKLDKYNETLKLIQIISTPGQAQPMVVHPNKKFLYVGVRPDFKIITYFIDQLGLLKNIGNTKIFSSPTYLMCNTEGTILYCASYHHNTISVLPIHTSGMLELPVQIIQNLLGCHSIGIDKYKKYMWAPCLKNNLIQLFEIDIFGMLITTNSICIKNNLVFGPRHIIFHDTDYYAYVINELNSTVIVINYNNSQKNINIVQTLSIIPENITYITPCWGADIHITPNGKWLYCSDRTTNIISSFKVFFNTKKLKLMSCCPTEIQPRGFAIDSMGKYIIVAGQKTHHISLYRIDQDTGELKMLSRYASGKGPMWICILSLN